MKICLWLVLMRVPQNLDMTNFIFGNQNQHFLKILDELACTWAILKFSWLKNKF